MLVLGVTFYAGYGWRMLVERRLHNMPWLKKSARKAALAAAQSTRPPVVLRSSFDQAEPLERQMLPENGSAQHLADTPAVEPTPGDASQPSRLTRQVGRQRRKSPRKKIATGEIKTAN